MKIKAILSTVLILLAVVGAIRTFSKSTQQQPIDPQAAPMGGKLKWFAEQAKAKGEEQVVIPARNVDYSGSSLSTDIDDALSYYSVVVAQPVQERSYAANPDTIVTWYKFRTLETLSREDSSACADCSPPVPPQSFLPLGLPGLMYSV